MKKDMLRIIAGIVLLASLLACRGAGISPTEEPPGVGEKAEKGYAASKPVIAALEKYRNDHGAYPESLTELVPDYLPAAPTKTEDLDFFYSSTGDSYQFSFYYIGPGMNSCTFTPESKEWDCSGAY